MIDDDLIAAVGDPTRRQVLDLLLHLPDTTSTALADRLPVTRQAVAKHLAVLERAGLVHPEPRGRERRYTVDHDRLDELTTELRAVADHWDGRLRRIQQLAETLERETPEPTTLGPKTLEPE